MNDLTPSEKRQITKNIAKQLYTFLLGRAFEVTTPEINGKIDKADFEFTFGGQHFTLILLREPKKV